MNLIYLSIDVLGAVEQNVPSDGTLPELLVTPSPDVLPQLGALHSRGNRFGLIGLGVGQAALELALAATNLNSLVEPSRIIAVVGPVDHDGFGKALMTAQAQAGQCETSSLLLVSEHREERARALAAGWRVAPHLNLATAVLRGESLYYVKVTAPDTAGGTSWRQALRERELVPLYVTGPEGSVVCAIVSAKDRLGLCDLGFHVELLGPPDSPLHTELYLLRDDKQTRSGFLQPQGNAASHFGSVERANWLLGTVAEGLLVALPSGAEIDSCHFAEARHGHNLRLAPSLQLLEPFSAKPTGTQHTRPVGWAQPGKLPPRTLTEAELVILRNLQAAELSGYIDGLSGCALLPVTASAPQKIMSRHIKHLSNAVVVGYLLAELRRIGGSRLRVRQQDFGHETQVLGNIIAELEGQTSEVVMVSAHLDSTAQGDGNGYCPERDSAPGADDDASGVAAVLAIARTFAALAAEQKPKRTVRFALWNAEEQGMVGSAAYARAQAAIAAPIVGVFQMDMIGFCAQPGAAPFELHVGYAASAEVTERSLDLARVCTAVAPQVAPNLRPPELYCKLDDPASGRSDHASFQAHGYAACAVSEDFFLGTAADAPPQNPNYHTSHDQTVATAYAADVARVVAAAAWLYANS